MLLRHIMAIVLLVCVNTNAVPYQNNYQTAQTVQLEASKAIQSLTGLEFLQYIWEVKLNKRTWLYALADLTPEKIREIVAYLLQNKSTTVPTWHHFLEEQLIDLGKKQWQIIYVNEAAPGILTHTTGGKTTVYITSGLRDLLDKSQINLAADDFDELLTQLMLHESDEYDKGGISYHAEILEGNNQDKVRELLKEVDLTIKKITDDRKTKLKSLIQQNQLSELDKFLQTAAISDRVFLNSLLDFDTEYFGQKDPKLLAIMLRYRLATTGQHLFQKIQQFAAKNPFSRTLGTPEFKVFFKELCGYDIEKYYSDAALMTALGHILALEGKDTKNQTKLEGTFSHKFLSLHILFLVEFLFSLEKDGDDSYLLNTGMLKARITTAELETLKSFVVQEIEIALELRRSYGMLTFETSYKCDPTLIQAEAENIVDQITNIAEGDLVIPTGYVVRNPDSAHRIYAVLHAEQGQIYIRLDNLGAGCDKHISDLKSSSAFVAQDISKVSQLAGKSFGGYSFDDDETKILGKLNEVLAQHGLKPNMNKSEIENLCITNKQLLSQQFPNAITVKLRFPYAYQPIAQTEKATLIEFIKNMLVAATRSTSSSDTLAFIYTAPKVRGQAIALMPEADLRQEYPALHQQSAGNCAVENYFAGMYIRLGNATIFNLVRSAEATLATKSKTAVDLPNTALVPKVTIPKKLTFIEKLPPDFNLPSRNTAFTGRTEQLDNIFNTLSTPTTSVSAIVATAGLGGIGKTQLSLEYAHRHRKDYQGIAMINAETVTLYESFVALGEFLQLELKLLRQNSEAMIETIREYFEKHPGWLLIFDNADDKEVLQKYLPKSGTKILLTSRNTDWKDVVAEHDVIQLDIFSKDEALGYIKQVLKKDARAKITSEETESYNKLAQEMGYLPLALSHACACINEKGTVPEYLKDYRTKKRLLGRNRLVKEYEHVWVTKQDFKQLKLDDEDLNDKDIEALWKELIGSIQQGDFFQLTNAKSETIMRVLTKKKIINTSGEIIVAANTIEKLDKADFLGFSDDEISHIKRILIDAPEKKYIDRYGEIQPKFKALYHDELNGLAGFTISETFESIREEIYEVLCAAGNTLQLSLGLSLAKITGARGSKVALALMEVIGCLAPEGIPEELLRTYIQRKNSITADEAKQAVTDGIDLLAKYSLVRITKTGEQRQILMHRLVQEIMRNKILGENRILSILEPLTSSLVLEQMEPHFRVLATAVEDTPEIKTALFTIVRNSKQAKSDSTAAANAITILNLAATNFNGMDFRGIKIRGARLDRAMLDRVDFTGADLREVDFRQAWLRSVKFDNANMGGVIFGERVSIKVGSNVTSLSYSPDGQTLAIGGSDGTVKLWAVATSQLLRTLVGYANPVSSISYSPSGESMMTRNENGIGQLWKDNTVLLMPGLGYNQNWRIFAVNVRGKITLAEMPTGKKLQTLEHTGPACSLIYGPDGKTLVISSDNFTDFVELWDTSTGKIINTLYRYHRAYRSVSYSPDGKTLTTGGVTGDVILWRADTGKILQTLKGHADWVSSTSYSPDGQTLATGSIDGTVKLWEVSTSRLLDTLVERDSISSIIYSPDGKTLVTGSNGSIKFWDVNIVKLLSFLVVWHAGSVNSLSYSPDGQTLATGSIDGTVKLWEVSTGKLLQTLVWYTNFDGRFGCTYCIFSYSPNGQILATAGSQTNDTPMHASPKQTVKLWETRTGKLLQTLTTKQMYPITRIIFSPNGKTLVIISVDDISLLEVYTGKSLNTLTSTGDDHCCRISYNSDGQTLATASSSDRGTVKLWEAQTGKLLQTLVVGIDQISGISYSPKDEILAIMGYCDIVKLWEVRTGKQIVLEHTGSFSSLNYSPDGQTLMTGCRDGTIKLWDAHTGKLLQKILAGRSDSVNSISYSPDGHTLTAGDKDGTVKLWELRTGKLLSTLVGHASAVKSISYSPDGQTLATGGEDHTVKLWDISKVRENGEIKLLWSSRNYGLTLTGASIVNVRDLSEQNRQLILQKSVPKADHEDSSLAQETEATEEFSGNATGGNCTTTNQEVKTGGSWPQQDKMNIIYPNSSFESLYEDFTEQLREIKWEKFQKILAKLQQPYKQCLKIFAEGSLS